MTRYQTGFSERPPSIANFNPYLGISPPSTDLVNINVANCLQSNAIPQKNYLPANCTCGCMMDQHIGHAEIRVHSCRSTIRGTLCVEWIGTAKTEEREVHFTTDCDLEPNKKYHVVYERTEIPPDKS